MKTTITKQKGVDIKEMAESNWASHNAMEAPFRRNGMTIEEYEEERTYLYEHIDDFRNFTYMPLWKQRENERK